MHRIGRGHMLRTLIPQRQYVDSGEEVFSGAENNRADRNVHLVDQLGSKVLPDRGGPTTEANITTVSRLLRTL